MGGRLRPVEERARQHCFVLATNSVQEKDKFMDTVRFTGVFHTDTKRVGRQNDERTINLSNNFNETRITSPCTASPFKYNNPHTPTLTHTHTYTHTYIC